MLLQGYCIMVHGAEQKHHLLTLVG
jgi:hypothetical protein